MNAINQRTVISLYKQTGQDNGKENQENRRKRALLMDNAKVITAFEVRTEQDRADYQKACELLQGIAERGINPDAFPFIRAEPPSIYYKGLQAYIAP